MVSSASVAVNWGGCGQCRGRRELGGNFVWGARWVVEPIVGVGNLVVALTGFEPVSPP